MISIVLVLNTLKDLDDAWPFVDAVDEEEAPNYYTFIEVSHLILPLCVLCVMSLTTITEVNDNIQKSLTPFTSS